MWSTNSTPYHSSVGPEPRHAEPVAHGHRPVVAGVDDGVHLRRCRLRARRSTSARAASVAIPWPPGRGVQAPPDLHRIASRRPSACSGSGAGCRAAPAAGSMPAMPGVSIAQKPVAAPSARRRPSARCARGRPRGRGTGPGRRRATATPRRGSRSRAAPRRRTRSHARSSSRSVAAIDGSYADHAPAPRRVERLRVHAPECCHRRSSTAVLDPGAAGRRTPVSAGVAGGSTTACGTRLTRAGQHEAHDVERVRVLTRRRRAPPATATGAASSAG